MSGIVSISGLITDQRSDHDLVASSGKEDYFWPEFRQHVHLAADRLLRHGGKNWLLVCDDAYGFATGFFASLYAGCNLTLPANSQPGHFADILRDMDGALGLDSDRAAVQLDKFMPIFTPGLNKGKKAPLVILPPLPKISQEIRLYTSGSSGAPASIIKSLKCLEVEVVALEETFGHEKIKNIITTVPPYHLYGLLFGILWPLLSNRSFAINCIRYPEELMGAVLKKPGSMLISSPVFLKRALPFLDLPKLNSHLCGIFSSGSQLDEEVSVSYNKELNDPVMEIYGSTETGGIAYRSVFEEESPTYWTPFDQVDLRLSGDGLLLVKSPYLNEPGWLQTQDQVEIKANGRLELKGRADRIVKIEEHRVSLTDLERRLEDSTYISAARVILIQRENRKIISSVVVPTEEGWRRIVKDKKKNFVSHLRNMLAKHLSGIALPKKWRFVQHFPEDIHGKTTHAALSILFLPGQDRIIMPKILSCKQIGEHCTFDLSIPETLTYFEGHFEDLPILPGIVHVDWAIYFARTYLAVKGKFEKMKKVKFSRILQPDLNVTMDMSYDPEERRLAFSYASGGKEYSSGHVLFKPVCQ